MSEFQKYEAVKDYVYGRFAKIYYEPMRIAAFTHTNSVDDCITLLAISRNVNIESAKICALFHDFAQYAENCSHEEHARLSSIMASKYMEQSGLFSQPQIDEISFAIACHSQKNKYHSPLAEALKDADILARYLENPTKPPTDPMKKQRLLDACADLVR